jgi:DNA-directed RNA polymerase specialized sigma24 family protein
MEDQPLHDAFVELHGRRLHGFALLVTLGDQALAGMLTAEALARGAERMGQLRHPERAAAWLRASLTEAARGQAWGHQRPSETERRGALLALGVEPATYDALTSLDVRGRAAVAAAAVEGFAAADVHEIVGSDERVRRARRDYLTAYLAASRTRNATPAGGALTARVRRAASPVLSGSGR